jgi:uroporphyrinogen III methyltransferase/synthase
MKSNPGKVFLVGAGPGDPGLMTCRGLELLKRAQVLVYDHLVDPSLLQYCSPTCELIYVGKEASSHTMSQEEINSLLVDKAREGKVVVRLKGGDPFVFGRGGEEAEHLAREGVAFEVVPGVTSAIAAPAYAGIPVTHRRMSSSVAFITGHEDPTKGGSSLRWEKIAGATDTLVFLMGMKNLGQICSLLASNGLDPETPCAVIQWGTLPKQKVVVGDLSNIVEKVSEKGISAPAVLVVGEVVRLREKINWFERKPLLGLRVLVTRTRRQASKLSSLLKELGAIVVEVPTIEIAPPSDWDQMDRAIDRLGNYDWIIFTSENGVRIFGSRLWERGKDARALNGVKVAAIGASTAQALRELGLRADRVPDEFVAEALAGAFKEEEVRGSRFLLIRAEKAREVLPDALREMGGEVEVVAAYRTRTPDGSSHRLGSALQEGIDLVTFTSSSTVVNFAEMSGAEDLPRLLEGVTVACIGPVTANTVRRYGVEPQIVAETYTVQGLVHAITRYYEQRGRNE